MGLVFLIVTHSVERVWGLGLGKGSIFKLGFNFVYIKVKLDGKVMI